jgi:hypothetical protein
MKTETTSRVTKQHQHVPTPDRAFLLPCTMSIRLLPDGGRIIIIFQRCGLCGRVFRWH